LLLNVLGLCTTTIQSLWDDQRENTQRQGIGTFLTCQYAWAVPVFHHLKKSFQNTVSGSFQTFNRDTSLALKLFPEQIRLITFPFFNGFVSMLVPRTN
jgi:hypothetical protein